MRIGIKKLKTDGVSSEYIPRFQCVLCIDGVDELLVSNNGYEDTHDYRPIKEGDSYVKYRNVAKYINSLSGYGLDNPFCTISIDVFIDKLIDSYTDGSEFLTI